MKYFVIWYDSTGNTVVLAEKNTIEEASDEADRFAKQYPGHMITVFEACMVCSSFIPAPRVVVQ